MYWINNFMRMDGGICFMVRFLDGKTENAFRRFVQVELAEKYQQPIFVEDSEIVSGLLGKDIIEEALIIRLFIADSKTERVEDKISTDIHRYCYENDLKLNKRVIIERDIWNGRIRYGIVYTDGKLD